MADENQNQTPEPTPGNSPEARTPTGEMKDQNSSTQQSGDQNPATPPKSEGSFLNRKPEAAPVDGDKKPEGEKAPEGEKKPEDVKPQAAPEKYEDFKLPDGYKLSDDVGKQATALFKELNLSQEGAQKLVDLYAANGLAAAKAPYDLWAKTQSDWLAEIDNRFGSRAEGMRTDINKAIDVALPPKLRSEFREALDLTGAGSHPGFVEALAAFVKPFLEGTSVAPGRQSPEANKAPAAPARPSAAEAIYPHLAANRGQQ